MDTVVGTVVGTVVVVDIVGDIPVEVDNPAEGDTLAEDKQVVGSLEEDILAEGGTLVVEGILDHKGVELQKSTNTGKKIYIHYIKCPLYTLC